mgnify:CR=1 FL=1
MAYQASPHMCTTDWWSPDFMQNTFVFRGFETHTSLDQGIYRYEPQFPAIPNGASAEQVWWNRMMLWRQMIVIEKTTQYTLRYGEGGASSVEEWPAVECWQDEPVVLWIKPSNASRRR